MLGNPMHMDFYSGVNPANRLLELVFLCHTSFNHVYGHESHNHSAAPACKSVVLFKEEYHGVFCPDWHDNTRNQIPLGNIYTYFRAPETLLQGQSTYQQHCLYLNYTAAEEIVWGSEYSAFGQYFEFSCTGDCYMVGVNDHCPSSLFVPGDIGIKNHAILFRLV